MFALQEQPHKPQAVCKSKSLIYILKPKGLLGKSQAPPKAEEWEPASNHEHKAESLISLADGLLLCHTSLNCHCSWKHAANHDRDPAGCSQEPRQTLTCCTGRFWYRHRAVCDHSRGFSSQCPISSSGQTQMPTVGFKVRPLSVRADPGQLFI